MKKISKRILIISFILIIFCLGIVNLLNRTNPEVLFFENRKTAEAPKLTGKSLFEGKYFDDLEKYISDNFIYRTKFLKFNTYISKYVIKRPETNDIIKKDGRLLFDVKNFGYEFSDEKAAEVAKNYGRLAEKLKQRGKEFIFVGIPTNPAVFKDQYNPLFPCYERNWKNIDDVFFSQLEKNSVNCVKMWDVLYPKREASYFKTDHHYNFYGAYDTYAEIIKKINSITDYNLDYENIKFIDLNLPLKGSYLKKIFNMDDLYDKAIIYDIDFDYKKYDYRSKYPGDIFVLNDKTDNKYYNYGIYMGGDISISKVETGRKNLPNILIYGDSFTNALETIMARSANTMVSLDFRYLKENKKLMDYVDEFDPDIVICVRDSNIYLSTDENGITK